jgi:hypothetical protein
MYNITKSNNIITTTRKLYEAKPTDRIRAISELTEAQKNLIAEYCHESEFTKEDIELFENNLLQNCTDGHLYALWYDDTDEDKMYWYEELVLTEPAKELMEVVVSCNLTINPMFHPDIPKGYQFIGTDEDGNILYRKEVVMQFHSITEASRWVDEQNRINPPYLHFA